MPWTLKQKTTAAMACKAAGISSEQRTDVILRNFANAHYGGDITSTSPRLNNQDFVQFMAIVEGQAGGRLLRYEVGHWQRTAADRWTRMRARCQRIDAALQSAGIFHPDSLGGWINKRVSAGTHSRLEELDFHGLQALTLQLESFCRQRKVKVCS